MSSTPLHVLPQLWCGRLSSATAADTQASPHRWGEGSALPCTAEILLADFRAGMGGPKGSCTQFSAGRKMTAWKGG